MLEVIFSNAKPKENMVRVIAMKEGEPSAINFLDEEEADLVQKAIGQSGFEGKFKEHIVVYGGFEKIVLFGLGKNNGDLDIIKAGECLFDILQKDEFAYVAADNSKTAINLAFGVLQGSYSFDKYKTEKKLEEFTKLEQIELCVENPEEVNEVFKSYLALVNGIRYCKDLCNEPPSYLTPEVFAADIKRLEYLGLDVEILDMEQIKLRGLGLVEAVGKSSVNLPYVVVIKWCGDRVKKEFDLGLVGKGVCFDAGGVSLKSNSGMNEMKTDMSGAAAVVAAMKVAALRRVRKNIVAVVGLAENMLGANAMKIGDIYTSYEGKTVEITNADAEGRLIVADCLAYLQKNYGADKIVDMVTIAPIKKLLGSEYAAVFSNDEDLAVSLLKAGENSGEKLWRLPENEKEFRSIASEVADVKNASSKEKNVFASICFLAGFVENNQKWAHIDMNNVRADDKGLAKGFGVKLLTEYIGSL